MVVIVVYADYAVGMACGGIVRRQFLAGGNDEHFFGGIRFANYCAWNKWTFAYPSQSRHGAYRCAGYGEVFGQSFQLVLAWYDIHRLGNNLLSRQLDNGAAKGGAKK